MSIPPDTPLRYEPALEQTEAGESKAVQILIDAILKIAAIVFRNSGHARRGVHAKGHALLVGEIVVASDLPAVLRQGLFEQPGAYPCVMRFSTIPGDMLDDSIQVPRGLGLKIVGVAGARLPDFEDDVTQDFLFANGPAFGAPTIAAFGKSLKLLAATTDWPQAIKKIFSTLARGAERTVELFGAPNKLLLTLGGYPPTNLLSDDYFSQGPLLFGAYIAKLQVTPVSDALLAIRGKTFDLSRPDALRELANNFMATQEARWELRAQLALDPKSTPIEDASAEWPQTQSPYVTIAQIRAAPQVAWSAEKSEAAEDAISFNPWRGLAAHRPLGAIMRARRRIYAASVAHRIDANRVTLRDPRSVNDLPKG